MAKAFLDYNTRLKVASRNLRNHSTKAEIRLWKALRAGQLLGYKFNRQKPLANYIVDFYCKPAHLVIEIDGSSHRDSADADALRQQELEKLGLRVLRFTNAQVTNDLQSVLQHISSVLTQIAPP